MLVLHKADEGLYHLTSTKCLIEDEKTILRVTNLKYVSTGLRHRSYAC